jgi:uncharacterized sporulation protein YeaH/YhbH (DUF444 family)
MSEEKRKRWENFITKTVKRAVRDELKSYKIPEGYVTCVECGTIYPEDFECPKCKKGEKIEEPKVEEPKKEEQEKEEPGEKPGDKTSDSSGEKSGEDNGDDFP